MGDCLGHIDLLFVCSDPQILPLGMIANSVIGISKLLIVSTQSVKYLGLYRNKYLASAKDCNVRCAKKSN